MSIFKLGALSYYVSERKIMMPCAVIVSESLFLCNDLGLTGSSLSMLRDDNNHPQPSDFGPTDKKKPSDDCKLSATGSRTQLESAPETAQNPVSSVDGFLLQLARKPMGALTTKVVNVKSLPKLSVTVALGILKKAQSFTKGSKKGQGSE